MLCFEDDLVIVDLDGGIFVPKLTELYAANESIDFKTKNAFALCEKVLMPKKLAVSLVKKLKEAISAGDDLRADFLLQKVCLCFGVTDELP